MGRHKDEVLYPGEVFDGRWEVGAFLGDGNFSIVFECRDRVSGKSYAIKILSVTQNSVEHLAEFENDGELLELLAGRSNIIEIEARGLHPMTLHSSSGVPVVVNVPYIVLERADASLAELLVTRHSLSWAERLDLFRQVVKGMHQMHLFEIVNRDLKSDNALVTASGKSATVALSDFGRGRNTRNPARFSALAYQHGRGDSRFSPPEMIWGLGVDDPEQMRLADLFLIGSVLFEFATGVGLTAIVLGDPLAWRERARAMSEPDRMRDFASHAADLQTRFGIAYDVFEAELPAPIRQVGCALLEQLTAVIPEQRQPHVLGRPRAVASPWDLQWVLRRVDIMRLTLAHAETERMKKRGKRP